MRSTDQPAVQDSHGPSGTNEPRGTNEPSGADGSAGPTDPRRERTRERRLPNEPSRARPNEPGDAAAQRNRRSEEAERSRLQKSKRTQRSANPNEPEAVTRVARVAAVPPRTSRRRFGPGHPRERAEAIDDAAAREWNQGKRSRQMREIVISATPEKKFCKRRKNWRCGIARSCKQSGRWQYLHSQPQ